MNILVSGAGGLLGSALTPVFREKGWRTVRLVRRAPASPDEVEWDAHRGLKDAAALPPLHAVVHLAGESIAGGIWTAARMRRIRESRAVGTRVLAASVAALHPSPAVFLSASAIGWYGSRGDEKLDESSAPGTGFLAEVGREWEAALEPARAAGIRTVSTRFGLVLSTKGGLLGKMLPVFRAGLGGPLGNGRQWVAWVTVDDLCAALVHVLQRSELSGAVNVVAPGNVTNEEFTRTLARVLHRPAFFRVPAALLRLLPANMADETFLASQRVTSRRLAETGFVFRDPDLEGALRRLLKKD